MPDYVDTAWLLLDTSSASNKSKTRRSGRAGRNGWWFDAKG